MVAQAHSAALATSFSRPLSLSLSIHPSPLLRHCFLFCFPRVTLAPARSNFVFLSLQILLVFCTNSVSAFLFLWTSDLGKALPLASVFPRSDQIFLAMAHPSPSSSPAHDDKVPYRLYTGVGKQSFKNSTSEPKQQRSFWSILAKKAKSALLDDGLSTCSTSDSGLGQDKNCETSQMQYTHSRPSAESKQRRSEIPALQKRLEALTSSLSSFGGTIGNAIEEGLNMVETKTTDFMSSESRLLFTKKTVDPPRSSQRQDLVSKSLQRQDSGTKSSSQEQRDFVSKSLQQRQSVSKPLQKRDFISESLQMQVAKPSQLGDSVSKPSQQPDSGIPGHSAADKDTQLKASRDVAMAMAAKAKLLLRELKEAKADLAVAKDRCAQLEEENKMIRESLSNGVKPDEEDLVRIQLETLLAEKARLAQENAYYVRENEFLREILEYHRLTMQGSGAFMEQSILEATEFASDPNIEETEDLPSETIISTVSS